MMGSKRESVRDAGESLRAARDRSADLSGEAADRLRAGADAIARAAAAVAEALSPAARAVGGALAPAGRAVLAGLALVAPYVSRALWALIDALLWLISRGLDLALAGWRRLRALLAAAAPQITPARVTAVVAVAAAVALVASQFMDYRGIAIGKPGYEGSVGAVAPAPQRELRTAGSAHLYLLAPLGLAALAMIGLALRGDRRAALALAALGGLGIVVSLAVDLPKGLDEGTAATAYFGAEAQLIAGFWLQVLCCAVLVLCGLLLFADLRQGDPGGRGG